MNTKIVKRMVIKKQKSKTELWVERKMKEEENAKKARRRNYMRSLGWD